MEGEDYRKREISRTGGQSRRSRLAAEAIRRVVTGIVDAGADQPGGHGFYRIGTQQGLQRGLIFRCGIKPGVPV